VHTGISPAGRCKGGSETHHYAGRGDCGRRRLSGGRPADSGRARSTRRRDRDRGRDRGITHQNELRATMVKGYWIARLDINDQAAYDEYRKRNALAFAKFGGKFLVRGGSFHQVVGDGRQHNVVIEFPSHDAAIACYRSPEYQDAVQYLKAGCDVDLVIIGGYDGPQPG